MKLLSTSEAAALKGVTVRRIQQLITGGQLPAVKIGRDYLISEKDLAKVTVYRKPGRPAKLK